MKLIYWLSKNLVKCTTLILYRHKVYGVEHFPSGAAILAPNHASFLDPPLVGISAPEDIYYLARKTLFDNPFLSWLLPHLNTYPVEGSTNDLATFKQIQKMLTKHYKVVIFPEGERTEYGQLIPFKGGIGMLAMRAHCPIIPVYIHGTFEIWDRSRKYPKWTGRTAVVFGSLINSANYSHLPKKTAQEMLATDVHDSIARLRQWYLDGAKGTPP